MNQSPERIGRAPDPGLRFREFVGLIAALMAASALAIDSMLVALPDIGRSLGVASENDRQWVITIFMLGFGGAQIVYGPLADRYGRKPVLIWSMLGFAVMSFVAAFATSYPMFLAARFLEGIAVAGSRVLAVSIVRDCYSGRQMARVMSLSMMVFLAVPVLAPSIGQLIVFVVPWPGIFVFLGLFGAIVATWGALRLNETLHPEYRRPISVSALLSGFGAVLTRRQSVGYTLGSTVIFGSLVGYISSIQQIFSDVFHQPKMLPIVFAAGASMMGMGAFTNSRIVERIGSRKVSHGALCMFILVAVLHLLHSRSGNETIWVFGLFMGLQMACFTLIGSNFSSMAMEPVGDLAGTASSIQGFTTTVGGAMIGSAIGQSFDGTTQPMAMGFVLVSLVALGIVLVTERGKLFRPHHVAPAQL
ncbi:multidrug effflux MFS transporter [Sphingomonas naphthae]|uniref:Multidrug effflux MFS transporter n=1 Tax=Sphingomonas naphthae TaxID=1813468 RepID=A0ABY7TLI7_9SPHN|nr:multidrug effflux MFS transporter [Sphingomonas naphthae]WCT74103.1 multidrug effflux MFS transporter [Sphingomonas naphthae]